MDGDRVNNALRNTKWGVFQKTTNLLFPFIVRSVLIHILGAEYSGLNGLFVSILSVLNLTELGFSNAIIFSMYKPAAEDNIEKMCALLNLYKRIYRIVGAIVTGFGLVVLPFVPDLITGEVPSDINIYILFIAFLLDSVLDYFLFGYKTSLLSVYQKEYVISRNSLIYNITLYSAQILVVVLAKNYYLFVLLIPVCRVILNFMNSHNADRMFPEIVPKGRVSDSEIKELKKNVYGLAIWKIGGASRSSFDSIFISKFLGLVTIAIYSNYFCVINGVDTIISVICTSITAGVGNKIAMESRELNYEDFRKFQFLYMWIVGWCVVCIYCLIQPFMRLWMGDDYMFSNEIVILLCYYFFMLKKGDINSVYYHAAGLWWNGRYRSIVEAVLNLILNYFLGKYFGIIGIILATIISFSIVNLYGSYIVFRDYFKNKQYIVFCLENLCTLSVVCVSCMVTQWVIEWVAGIFNVQGSVPYLAIGGLACIVIPNIIFALVYCFRNPYRSYMVYAWNVFQRRRR